MEVIEPHLTLPKLENLNISNNKIKALCHMDGLPMLRNINASKNNLEDVAVFLE